MPKAWLYHKYFVPIGTYPLILRCFLLLFLLRNNYLGHDHDFAIERKIHNNSKFPTQTLLNNFFNSVFASDIISFWSYILDLLFFTIHLPSIITYFTSLPDA